MRYAASLLDKLTACSSAGSSAALASMSLAQVRNSVAFDLEALLNTRRPLNDFEAAAFPLSAQSIYNYGVADFTALSLSSSIDRDQICASIGESIAAQDRRLTHIKVTLAGSAKASNRLTFTIEATLEVSQAAERVSFDARFEPMVQRYTVARPLLDAR